MRGAEAARGARRAHAPPPVQAGSSGPMTATSHVVLYDTTLRDGAQTEGISYSVQDKLRITERLDAFGIPLIEGGYPANLKDLQIFTAAKRLKLTQAALVAFGSTRHASKTAAKDPHLQALLKAGTRHVTIFGKTWDLHVRDVLRVSPDE